MKALNLAQRISAGMMPSPSTWYVRLHAALMPGYNRKAALFWWIVVVLGVAALGHSLWTQRAASPSTWLHIAVGASLAMLASYFPIRGRNSDMAYSAGDVFLFVILLMQGPQAAAIAGAAEAIVGAWRSTPRWTGRIVSPAIAAINMLCTGSLLHWAVLNTGARADVVLGGSLLFGYGHFLLNMVVMNAIVLLLREERPRWSQLFGALGWLGIAGTLSAIVAASLYLVFLRTGYGVLLATLPLLGLVLATQFFYFRQQEEAAAARRAAAVAAQREAEATARHLRELEASERRFQSAFTNAAVGMALTDADGRILQANGALQELAGGREADLLGTAFHDLVDPEDQGAVQQMLAQSRDAAVKGSVDDLRLRRLDGVPLWICLHSARFAEGAADSPSLILQAQDVSARREAEGKLRHIAYHDSLTGLPNRRRFLDLLDRSVRRAGSDSKHRFAVLYLDFDRFKFLNDSRGHNAGDEFLVQVAQRISDSLRPGDIVARLGGDGFAVLVFGVEEQTAANLTDRILHVARQPYVIAGAPFASSASIGITFSGYGYERASDVLRDADAAMYQAKAAGRDRYAVFRIGGSDLASDAQAQAN
ncbi:GGDEF domain-containing protein [Aquincola sp. S2]|uniref:GGDEF domain-containing protein n=1 Tax=Pseudaquabacterium terrae TaxID=2732868 RepID=A0ABX2EU44_9BURK|nr:sensor domain-containing diguanylate cyclase [Aquabacterium terrae]NRF72156.1 GGDEF domain-containing protein [Aquabacterium terrae]